jgi:Glycosyltransferase
MKISYLVSDYISHFRAGQAYMACLETLGHTLVEDPGESDLVIIHEGPHEYKRIMKTMPRRAGRKYVGYGVWETPQLPARFIEGVRCMDAIWTCSEFSRQAFAPYAETFLLPHVVERPKASRADMAWAMERIGMTGAEGANQANRTARDTMYFYTILDTVNPRKGAEALFTAFAAAFPHARDNVRLVVKQYRKSLAIGEFPHVIDIPEFLTDGQIAALHAVCDVYVSAHRAEAWGLPLSEALSFGNPVIATGYSGNMEFMTEENSFPVPYDIVPISERMCQALPELFAPEMTWAEIDVAAFVRILRQVRSRPVDAEFRARAAQSVKAFSPEVICERLRALLDAL